MGTNTFILDLAKLVISAAWADGELANAEVNALKDLLFSLDEVSADDWTILNMYMDSPTSEEEKNELLERVLKSICTSEDKTLAIATLERLFQADGKVTADEAELMESLKSGISETNSGVFSGFSKALKSAISQRRAAVESSCLRECNSDDYIQNTIYYDLMRKQEIAGITIDRPDAELRKLCLGTGLLSHIADVDSVISEGEEDAIREVIAEDWDLSKKEADMIAGIATDRATRGLDYFRLSCGFFECTTLEERRKFLRTLFRVANASNKTDNDEIEEIRRVAKSLKLSHKDFIDAKLTIPREDRDGL